MKNPSITFSAPGKVHLLGEHTVVYGKPALLATVDLRITVTLNPCHSGEEQKRRHQNLDSGCASLARMTNIIEPIVKKHCKIKTIPPYQINISSQFPTGVGLGSSAAISAAYIAALLTYLEVKWDKALINELTFQAEKAFHGNPSGGDNSTVVFGGLIWFTRTNLKLIQPLSITIPSQIAKNFILINTGIPKESTKEMVELVNKKFKAQSLKFKKIFNHQEQLVKDLLAALKNNKEKELISIIRKGEKNLEDIGVVSSFVKSIIRKIEKNGGAAKICGGGGQTAGTGVLLCYHSNSLTLKEIAKDASLPYFLTTLGVEGLRQEES